MNRLRTAAALAAGAASLLFVFAPSAAAADRPTITIDSPAPGAVLDSANVTISGRATMHEVGGLQTNRVVRVSVQVSSPDGPKGCGNCIGGEAFSVPFSWSGSFARNGPVSFTVEAEGWEAVDVNGPESSSATRSFSLAVPPAAPRDVTVTVNPDRTVDVTWAKNGEPDLIGYRVQRQDPGGDFVDASGLVTGTSLHDDVPAQGGGGKYTYRVQAIRNGRDGTAGTAVTSGFSGKGADVPTPTGQPAPPGPGGGPPGSTPAGVTPGSPPGLKGFLAGKGGGPASSSPKLPTLPGVTDGGFDLNLPYPAGAKRGSGPVETLTAGAAGLASNPRALAIPVAAGLVLTMASMHLRVLSRRMDQLPVAAEAATAEA